jgi:membrane protein implicated in regulation of membrane protease activity
MIVLGLLLILIAVGATVFALMAPSATAQTIEVTGLGVKVSASPLAMFCAGAVSLALLALGYALISRGTRRRARSRKELRDLRKEQAAGATAAAEEGQRTSRRDRPQKDADTESGTDTSSETSSDDSKGLPTERQPDTEQPSAS